MSDKSKFVRWVFTIAWVSLFAQSAVTYAAQATSDAERCGKRLIELCCSEHAEVRRGAADVIGKIKAIRHPEDLRDLTRVLERTDDPYVWKKLLQKVKQGVKSDNEEVLSAFVALIRSDAKPLEWRQQLAKALRQIGPTNTQVISTIGSLFYDPQFVDPLSYILREQSVDYMERRLALEMAEAMVATKDPRVQEALAAIFLRQATAVAGYQFTAGLIEHMERRRLDYKHREEDAAERRRALQNAESLESNYRAIMVALKNVASLGLEPDIRKLAADAEHTILATAQTLTAEFEEDEHKRQQEEFDAYDRNLNRIGGAGVGFTRLEDTLHRNDRP